MKMELKEYSHKEEFKKWIPSLLILIIAVYLILNRGKYTWIDNADLVIHEAGHVFFMFFGRFIYSAGGTLMQIILPLLIAWYFFRNSYRLGIQISLLWLGQNLINISVYAADARARVLPLLGGNKVSHDWHYMLGELNILEYDQVVGYLFVGISILVFITAVLMPLLIRE